MPVDTGALGTVFTPASSVPSAPPTGLAPGSAEVPDPGESERRLCSSMSDTGNALRIRDSEFSIPNSAPSAAPLLAVQFPPPQDTGRTITKPDSSQLPGLPTFPGLGQQKPDTAKRDTAKRDTARMGAARDTTRRDTTLKAGRLVIKDTTYVVYHDSTARLKEFTYRRVDSPQVRLFPDRTYPLFGQPKTSMIRRSLTVDSTGSTVIVSETLGDANIRVPVTVPLTDYIRAREKAELHRMFAEDARKPKQLMERNDLGELLSNITKIQIPMPPSPIFSIFGKNDINLNISGAVDIKAGFRNTKSDQTTLSSLDQSRNEPDFSQEVQVNVNGTIGDKLNILADWNTQRTVRV